MYVALNRDVILEKFGLNMWIQDAYKADDANESQSVVSYDCLLVAYRITERTVKYVPVDTGYLKNSLYIKPFGSGIEIGYTAEYAIYVHEIGFNHHEAPTKYKYLEDAAFEVAIEYFDETGTVIPINIEYKPLRVFIGVEDAPGERLLDIKNREQANQSYEMLNKMWDWMIMFDSENATEMAKTHYNNMMDFFDFYRNKRGYMDWSVLSEWVDRMRHK